MRELEKDQKFENNALCNPTGFVAIRAEKRVKSVPDANSDWIWDLLGVYTLMYIEKMKTGT
jgi:hypothetical protein